MVPLTNINQETILTLQQKMQEWNILDVTLSTLVFLEEENKERSVYASLSDNVGHRWQTVSGRLAFTKEEISRKEKVAILSVAQNTGQNVLVLNGETYRVVGVYNQVSPSGSYYIPSSLFLDIPAESLSLEILVNRKFTRQEEAVFFARLDSLGIPSSNLLRPSGSVMAEQALPEQLVTLLLIQMVMLSGVLFFLHYLSLKNRRMDAICGLAGASKGTLFSLLLLERLLLTALSTGFAVFLYRLLYQPFFRKLYLTEIVYDSRDYLVMFLLMLCASFLVSIPFALADTKKTPAMSLRQA